MKFKLSLAILLFSSGFIQAQEPTYEEILSKEILANDLVNSDQTLQKPYVVMVSIDGFRYDYAEKYGAKNLLDMAENGSSVRRLIPSFPSKTFPNHYTLVTGLYPENHGLVSNSFYDPSKKESYAIAKRSAVEDGSWYGGIPLWNLAQKQGMCAASYYWVGPEANINGLHPKYYYPYLKSAPYPYRVQRVKEWLSLPEAVRPHFVTLYFSLVDSQGHTYGPDAKETEEAVLYVDEQIGALRKAIKELDLPITLIVTADHGMSELSQYINIHDYVQLEKDQFFSGPVAMIYTKNEVEKQELFDRLVKEKGFETYKKEMVPAYLHYQKSDKIGDLVLITQPPYSLIYSEKEVKPMGKPGGTHGYDPMQVKEMSAIFYAEGPGIKKGFQLPAVENIHVYPFVAQLLGLSILSPIDGRIEGLKEMILP